MALSVFALYTIAAVALAAPSLPSRQQHSKLGSFESYYPSADVYDFGAAYVPVSSSEAKSDDVQPKVASEAVINTDEDFAAHVFPDDVHFEADPSVNPKPDAFVINEPMEQQAAPQFQAPADSVVPKFTGSFLKGVEFPSAADAKEDVEDSVAVSNPAAFYLEGANLENLKPSSCKMLGCDGPVANDGDIFISNDKVNSPNKACHQTFVPLNGCVNNRGYPVGMVCTICCDCSADFMNEISHSRGFKQGYETVVN
uniref:ShKT domain-containing protein n=1 Tax=Panagrellus redivivus TaxID=6233 RepID=A0A7E4VIH1_PANRE